MNEIVGRREAIVTAFSEWTAFCAARRGRSSEMLYPLIRKPEYSEILRAAHVSQDEFEKWHAKSTMAIHDASEERLSVGWGAKLINVYLKTRVYIARDFCSSNLIEFIHPPIDNMLVNNIRRMYGNRREIWQKISIFSSIAGISDYSSYRQIIDGCREIAKERQCLLIEVDELWQPVSRV
jgi:hypothetical protein